MPGSLKKPSSPTATRWLGSIDLMYAEISEIQFVSVAVVQVPDVVLDFACEIDFELTAMMAYPVLPAHLGSFESSQPRIVGSLT